MAIRVAHSLSRDVRSRKTQSDFDGDRSNDHIGRTILGTPAAKRTSVCLNIHQHSRQFTQQLIDQCVHLLTTSKSAVREQLLLLLHEIFRRFRCHLSKENIRDLIHALLTVASDSTDPVIRHSLLRSLIEVWYTGRFFWRWIWLWRRC